MGKMHHARTNRFHLLLSGLKFSNLAVIGQSFPWRKNSPSLWVSAFSYWRISTGMFELHPVGSGIFVGPNRSINDIISHPIVEQRAAMFKFKMKKHLYYTETYFPMAHQHYCLRRRKSISSYKKEGNSSQATFYATLWLHSLPGGLIEKNPYVSVRLRCTKVT